MTPWGAGLWGENVLLLRKVMSKLFVSVLADLHHHLIRAERVGQVKDGFKGAMFCTAMTRNTPAAGGLERV